MSKFNLGDPCDGCEEYGVSCRGWCQIKNDWEKARNGKQLSNDLVKMILSITPINGVCVTGCSVKVCHVTKSIGVEVSQSYGSHELDREIANVIYVNLPLGIVDIGSVGVYVPIMVQYSLPRYLAFRLFGIGDWRLISFSRIKE